MGTASFDFVDKNSIAAAVLSNKNDLKISFLENGSVFSIVKGNVLINQLMASPVESALSNIYVRVHGKTICSFPVMGPRSHSTFCCNKKLALWKGKNKNLSYSCALTLSETEDKWFWCVDVKNIGTTPESVDIIFSQDLGLGSFGMVRSNEAYASQYIDHEPLKHPKHGYIIYSRQGQKQDRGFPWIMHGCLEKAVGYLTDGFQFYGLEHKATGIPAALTRPDLPNERMQYEFAMPTLQAPKVSLAPGKSLRQVFFASYSDDHAAANGPKDLENLTRTHDAWANLSDRLSIMPPAAFGSASLFDTSRLFNSRDLTPAEVTKYVGSERRHEEKGLSFFCGRDTHVVLRAKELVSERPHGHIMRSGKSIMPSDDTLATTAWMYGAFNSHVVIGNTNFNKALSFSRSNLNLHRSSGQRIFIKTARGWELLGVPSLFEMGVNNARWIYQGENGENIVVKAWASINDPACFLEIEASGAHEFLITNSLVLGNNDLDHAGRVVADAEQGRIELVPTNGGLLNEYYPEARFFIVTKDKKDIAEIGGDELLYSDSKFRKGPFAVIRTNPVAKFSLAITGNVLKGSAAAALADKFNRSIEKYDDAKKEAAAFWTSLSNGAELKHKEEGISKLNDILPWYIHNAMIHFTSPHGLEQYSGAAWGLRDVCQGPTEFLCATRNYKQQRETVKMVFANQFLKSGDWPQWFMFDRYGKIRSTDSHGDIIVWPLKALCEYIESTNDFSILKEEVGYIDDTTCAPLEKKETIAQHVAREIAAIKAGCVQGTSLYHYGHGDWEDTLQPADPEMREHMVSSWTVELAFQTLTRFEKVTRLNGDAKAADGIKTFCENMKADFNKLLIKDKVVAGLVFFKGSTPQYMLHPRDSKTGVKYRLLPMTRGMTSSMFTPQQAEEHYKIVKDQLLFPDGVRLVNRPIPYKGGVEVYFKRAESASNFGREIGMQYVHAHIRYIEAMCMIGQAEDAYKGLLTICPIALKEVFKTSMPRQNNSYFSSSDANFADRYQAVKHFDDIKKLKVGIKGGWRVYSSGPGIYINQLMTNFLGIRRMFNDILIDPVLPKKLDGLTFAIKENGKKVTYKYHIAKNTYSPNRIVVNGKEIKDLRYAANPYRSGGALISGKAFDALLNRPDNVVEIYI